MINCQCCKKFIIKLNIKNENLIKNLLNKNTQIICYIEKSKNPCGIFGRLSYVMFCYLQVLTF